MNSSSESYMKAFLRSAHSSSTSVTRPFYWSVRRELWRTAPFIFCSSEREECLRPVF